MSLNNKTALVTGANGAIGYAIAENLARDPSMSVTLACRDKNKGEKSKEEIITRTGNKNVFLVVIDTSNRDSINSAAERWQGPLHILVNNAAGCPRTRQVNSSGIEYQFATNVLGYLWMIQAFQPSMNDKAWSRVVNVASYWAGNLDMKDLEFKTRAYNNDQAYRQSKQANRMLTAALSETISPLPTINSCHPGDVNSKLSNDLGFGGHESPDQGAATPVWAATSPELHETSGRYFSGKREAHCEFSQDKQACKALLDICLDY